MNVLNKKSVEDIDVRGKKVLIRCDFNVKMEDGVITSDKRIVASLPTIKYLLDNGAAVNVTGNLGASAYTVYMKKGLDACINENAEFGYDHALFVKNGTLNVTGNIRCASIQVGSVSGNTKGYLTVSSNGDALTRDRGNVQLDFANGAVSFNSSSSSKSLIMVNSASAKININIMENCTFAADNYKYVFYTVSSNTTSYFNYYEANFTATNCTNLFSKAVNVNKQ